MSLLRYYEAPSRNGIVAGVAPRIASEYSPDGQIEAFEGSMF